MNKVSYTGDGVTTEFYFNDIKWFQTSDIKVAVDNILATTQQYAVHTATPATEYETEEQRRANDMGITANFGGSIVFANAPVVGTKIDIYRKISLSRTICYQLMESIHPSHLNTDFDFLVEYLKDMGQVDFNLTELKNLLNRVQDLSVAEILSHMELKNNPHNVTREQVGLGNVNNTSDVNKPVSNATQVALNSKLNQDLSNVPTGVDYVIESSVAGANPWYRKYKSGWIEQGGVITTDNTNNATITVALAKPMANTDYGFVVYPIGQYTAWPTWYSGIGGANPRTTTSFTFIKQYANKFAWRVDGTAA